MTSTLEKAEALTSHLKSLGRLIVAYSGGVDSAYLAYAAHSILGSDMLAVIADSPSLPRRHLSEAIAFARQHSIPLTVIPTRELANPGYAKNDGTRCFHCKTELFETLRDLAADLDFPHIAYGMNQDDLADYRPGQFAALQHNILAPLKDAGLTKQEIRTLAREASLQLWDKPASACLSSRLEYGIPVTAETLARIEQGEEALYTLGFRQFRVRHHGETARIEIALDEMPRMLSLSMFEQVTRALKALGYKYVTLDLEGYRSGSMNAILPLAQVNTQSHRGPR